MLPATRTFTFSFFFDLELNFAVLLSTVKWRIHQDVSQNEKREKLFKVSLKLMQQQKSSVTKQKVKSSTPSPHALKNQSFVH